jgi:hypothetical protein
MSIRIGCVVTLLLTGCASVRVFPETAAANPPRPIPASAMKIFIVQSDLWNTPKGESYSVEYRVLYQLWTDGERTGVEITHRLKDRSGRKLAEKRLQKVQGPGIYPVSISFDLPGKGAPADAYYLEATIKTPFGSAIDRKAFSLRSGMSRNPGEEAKRWGLYRLLRSRRAPCPEGYRPMIREVKESTANATVSIFLECVPTTASGSEIIEDTGIYYPKTGSFYPIKRDRYPEFYRKADSDGDGRLSMDEVGELQHLMDEITARYPEGDIELIVRDFLRASVR